MDSLKVIATWDKYSNSPESGIVSPDRSKLPSIYRELRENVFLGEPIQENQGNNHLVYRDQWGPHGNYGWQLFRTQGGTAMLEYQGSVSYWPHEREPLPLGQDPSIQRMEITFHQMEESVETTRQIVARHTQESPSLVHSIA